MWFTLLIPILNKIFDQNGPIGQYIQTKQKIADAQFELQLAKIGADKDMAVAQAAADTSQLQSRLGATTQEFKQKTFWMLCAPVIFTMVFPGKAKELWGNLDLMPVAFQYLFYGVWGAIWGLPMYKFGSIQYAERKDASRDFKIQQIKALNEQAFYSSLRQTIFKQGMTQEQVNEIRAALVAGGVVDGN